MDAKVLFDHLWMNVSEKDQQINCNSSSVWSIVDVSLTKVSGEQRLFVSLIKTRNLGSSRNRIIFGLFLDKIFREHKTLQL